MGDPATTATSADGWRVERWLSDAAADSLAYSAYWNSAGEEHGKPFDVENEGFDPLERYLNAIGLIDDLRDCLAHAERIRGRPLEGQGIDVAAGVLWAAPLLLGSGQVERLYCLEYSRHRLLHLGPQVLAHYAVSPQRVVLAYGSFYELHLPDDSLDFAFLSQAYHHADDPARLLDELGRVLKPGGVAMIIGEHRMGAREVASYLRRAILSAVLPQSLRARLLRERSARLTARPTGSDLLARDPVLGDHAYTKPEYRQAFEDHGFAWWRLRRRGARYQSFVLRRN